MIRKTHSFPLALIFFTGFLLASKPYAGSPLGLFLTWQEDATTTMTVDWHRPAEMTSENLQVRLRGTEEWQDHASDRFAFPHSPDRVVFRVALESLQPGTDYEFRLGQGNGRIYSFRTLPEKADRPIRIVVGGDTARGGAFLRTNMQSMRYDPDFIVWGGDLPYANGRPENAPHWHRWFEVIYDSLISEEGRVVPIVLAIGNHEVRRGYWRGSEEATPEHRLEVAPFFYGLFAFPGQPGYGVIDAGDYLSVVILDSAHTNLIEGNQQAWLQTVLEERTDRPHVFPVYHVPAYPSVRSFTGAVSARVRESWVPLFEANGVKLAFENHDHSYKRTIPIRAGEPHPEGIVYIGDGAWGVGVREPRSPEEEWYLAESAAKHHAIVVTIYGDEQHVLVINTTDDGEILDQYPADRDPPEWVKVLEPKRFLFRQDLPIIPTATLSLEEERSSHRSLSPDNWEFAIDREEVGFKQQWASGGGEPSWEPFAIETHWNRTPAYSDYVGAGWYRSHFRLTPEEQAAILAGGTLELLFNGTDEMAWVFVNGELIGSHNMGPIGWDVPFAVHVPAELLRPEENQLVVMVQNTGEGGGIWRPIDLNILRE